MFDGYIYGTVHFRDFVGSRIFDFPAECGYNRKEWISGRRCREVGQRDLCYRHMGCEWLKHGVRIGYQLFDMVEMLKV